MFEALSKNISFLLAKKNLTSKELAAVVAMPLPTINRLRSDQNVNPTISSLMPLCNYFKVSIEQLVGLAPLVFDEHNNQLQPELKKIPCLAWDKIAAFKTKKDYSTLDQYIYSELQVSGHLLATKIDDMDWGFFKKGSTLLMALDKAPANGDYVIVRSLENNNIGIKQVLKDISATYLTSLIPGIDNVELNKSFEIFGVILQAKLDFKS